MPESLSEWVIFLVVTFMFAFYLDQFLFFVE